ncbi:MAG: hypothetical protein H6R00_903 [Proteobacteria bacterium]|nr:hypothetical protein [Pseudomonadota bacterium]
MSAVLHVPSLVIAAAVTGGCVSVSHLVIWRAVRNEICVLIWGVAYGLATISMIMLGLRGYIPALFSIVISNAMLLLASGLIWLGYRRFMGKSPGGDRLFALLGALVWLAFACDRQLFADINVRAHIVSIMQFFYLLILAIELVRQCRKERLPALVLTVVVIAFQQAMLVARIIYLLLFPLDPTIATLPSGPLIGLTLVGSMAVVVFSGLLQMALVAQRSERRFRIAAETDELTGLANRRCFHKEVLPRLADHPGKGALALFDLDHFKHINDTYGHSTGDRTLIEFARILAKAAPERAIIARVGGEEFALFFPDANVATAATFAELIRQLTHTCRLDTTKGELRFTVSGGVAGVTDVGSDYELLHSATDAALYKAKSEGRNRVVIHRPNPPTSQHTFSRINERTSQPATAAT